MSKVLAENLEKLRASSRLYGTQKSIALAAGVNQSSVGRILNNQHSPTVETLDKIAGVFGLQGWQLLVPDMDPRNPPSAELTADEVELYKRMRSLALGQSRANI